MTRRLREQDGSVVLWMLGVTMMVMALGGVSLDLWRAFSERRALASVADASAEAGAMAIDIDVYRQTGQVLLDPGDAEARAAQSYGLQSDLSATTTATFDADPTQVVVTVSDEVSLTLLGLVIPGGSLQIQATSVATPRASP